MAYEPLHHKYRPQTFAELVGQAAIATTLTSALRQQRIAPAYLFTGARGTGKTSSARILAKSLNCINGDVPTAEPCGHCEVCRAIANGSALDVIEIDAASNTGVDNIRELIERAQFAPVQCRYKVYVIDECHMLSSAAFNALLKTLEEPPDRVVFVLATTDPQRVLPTIISRCQRFDFRRIPLDDMVQHLGAIAAKETITIAPDALQLVSQISQGGLRDAESLLDQLSLLEGEIGVDQVWDLVGAVPERDLLTLARAIAQDQPTTVLDAARHLMDRGREPLIVLQNLASFYRDLLIAKTSPQRNDLVAITAPTWVEMSDFVQQMDIRTLLQGQQRLRESEVQVKNTTQPRLWLEVTLLGLLPSALATPTASNSHIAAPTPLPPSVLPPLPNPIPSPAPTPSPLVVPSAPAQAIRPIAPDPEPSVISAPEPQPIPDPVPTVANLPSDVLEEPQGNLDQIWKDVLQQVQPYSTQIMLNQQCQLLGFSGQTARVGARSAKLFQMAKDRLPNIEAAFEKLCDRPIRVSLEVIVASAPAASPAPANNHSNSSSHPNPPSPPPYAPPAREANASPTPRTHTPSPKSPEPPAAIAPSPSPETIPAAPTSEAPADPFEDLAPPVWQGEDDVKRAAKSFAQMFNGQIVNLDDFAPTDDLTTLERPGDLPGDLDDTDPDIDVPF